MAYNDLKQTIEMMKNEELVVSQVKKTSAEVLLNVALAIESAKKQLEECPNGYEVACCAAAIDLLVKDYKIVKDICKEV